MTSTPSDHNIAASSGRVSGQRNPLVCYTKIVERLCSRLEWPLTQENGQRMLQMMFNAGIKSRREDGSKGAWYISFKGSDVEHRGAPKAAEAMLPKIRDMLAADKDAGLPLGGLGQIVPGNMITDGAFPTTSTSTEPNGAVQEMATRTRQEYPDEPSNAFTHTPAPRKNKRVDRPARGVDEGVAWTKTWRGVDEDVAWRGRRRGMDEEPAHGVDGELAFDVDEEAIKILPSVRGLYAQCMQVLEIMKVEVSSINQRIEALQRELLYKKQRMNKLKQRTDAYKRLLDVEEDNDVEMTVAETLASGFASP